MTAHTLSGAVPIDADALEFFVAKLRHETDPSDVAAALAANPAALAVVDSRGDVAWSQGRIPGAVHLPTAEMAGRARDLLDPLVPVAVYCWGPGCNGSTRAAVELTRLGYRVREIIGGFEYWAREGLPVETDVGVSRRAPDPLTTPVAAAACDC